MRSLILSMSVLIFIFTGCKAKDFFQQPSVTVVDYELTAPPGEYTYLLMTCDIKNNDSHDGEAKNVTYKVTVEGVQSQDMTYSTPFTMKGGQTIQKKLPLTFVTADATALLMKIGGGSPLGYSVTGNIFAGTPLGDQDLPLNISGNADLTIDLNDFFLQPTITMDNTQGFVVTSIGSPPIPYVNPTGSPATVQINKTDVLNNDSHAVTVQKVIYTVNVNGAVSNKMTYTPVSPIPVAALETISINNLPITFNYTALLGVLNYIVSGTLYVNYTITGSVLVEADLGSGLIDFYVPLNTSGTNTMFVTP
ncbi:MAG: hypothetical protein WCJ94_02365 [bacterium]